MKFCKRCSGTGEELPEQPFDFKAPTVICKRCHGSRFHVGFITCCVERFVSMLNGRAQ